TTAGGTIAAAGQADNYTFTGAAGQRLFFDGLSGPSYYTLRAVLTGPSGEVVGVNQYSVYDDSAPFTLTEAGTYTLTVTGDTTGTGTYSYRLLDLAAAPTLALNATTSATLNPGAGTDLYSFAGSAGE